MPQGIGDARCGPSRGQCPYEDPKSAALPTTASCDSLSGLNELDVAHCAPPEMTCPMTHHSTELVSSDMTNPWSGDSASDIYNDTGQGRSSVDG